MPKALAAYVLLSNVMYLRRRSQDVERPEMML